MRTLPDIPLILEVLDCTSIEESTRVGVAFSQISRYLIFLNLNLDHYRAVSQRYVESSNARMRMFEDGLSNNRFTPEQAALLDEGEVVHYEVQLAIETFYLFAKILLDKVAQFIQFYFGQSRGIPLNSHDQLVKNFARFCEAKRVIPSSKFLDIAKSLKASISDHRDYRIAHEESPRTMYGTMHDSIGRPRISMLRLNPTERDKQIDSGPLEDLLALADCYIRLAIEVVKSKPRQSA